MFIYLIFIYFFIYSVNYSAILLQFCFDFFLCSSFDSRTHAHRLKYTHTHTHMHARSHARTQNEARVRESRQRVVKSVRGRGLKRVLRCAAHPQSAQWTVRSKRHASQGDCGVTHAQNVFKLAQLVFRIVSLFLFSYFPLPFSISN